MSKQPDIGWCPSCNRAVIEIPHGTCSDCACHTMTLMSRYEHEEMLSASQARLTEMQNQEKFRFNQVAELQRENAELRKLLKESKVPEGWQLVPIEPNSKMLDEICLVDEFTYTALSARYKSMLSAAPQPPNEPKQ